MRILNLVLIPLLLAAIVSASVPFTIDASEDVSSQFPGAPTLQSFSFAQWQGRWVFIGGRKTGYHSVGGGTAEFLRADANREVWVVDTTVSPARTYHVPLDQLPESLACIRDQWGSTAQASFQDGSQLYIAGGYGQARSGKWVTFPLISRVDLPRLIESVMKGRLPAESISFAETPVTQTSGGGLTKLGNGHFYLVMGHAFNGNYTAFQGQGERNGEQASQVYLNEIRKLKITDAGQGRLEVILVEGFRDEDEFHRRDLNVTQIMSPLGLGLAAYGGVFTPKTQLNYSKPVYLLPGSRPVVDRGFDQKMNVYTCPTLLIYDKRAGMMYTTFFGGIGRFSWDQADARFVENPRTGSKSDASYFDGLQWSDQISTIQIAGTPGKAQTLETVQPKPLPGFLGAGAIFIPAPGRERALPHTDILDLDPLRGTRTFAGYIYGGIVAKPYRFPYNKSALPHNSGAVPTTTSSLILKVYIEVPGR